VDNKCLQKQRILNFKCFGCEIFYENEKDIWQN
jgi:hypothetical protein